MSGHHNFDHTVIEGNMWLRRITERLHFSDERHSYSALRATLHALRDRLTPESAVHLAAQMPMVIRGLYFEGWKMSQTPTDDDTVDEFCDRIAKEFPPMFPMDPKTVAEGVLDGLWNELDPGEISKVIRQLPVSLRSLWPQIARQA